MTPIHIIYALSFLLIFCGVMLVNVAFYIRRKDNLIKYLREVLHEEISEKEWYEKKLNEVRSKLPKRNVKGQFTCK